jgi:hypothetical protein
MSDQSIALRRGSQAKELAGILLEQCGFIAIKPDVKQKGLGLEVSYTAEDGAGNQWAFELAGAFSSERTGLRRSDVLWRALGKAAVLHAHVPGRPLVILTTGAPIRGTWWSSSTRPAGSDCAPMRRETAL